jgi:hypothetical protein
MPSTHGVANHSLSMTLSLKAWLASRWTWPVE